MCGFIVAGKSALDAFIDRMLPDDVVGVDIGSSYVKMVKLAKNRSTYTLEKFQVLPIPRPNEVTEAEDHLIPNADHVKDTITDVFDAASLPINRKPMIISIGGKAVVVKRIYIDLEGLSDEEIQESLVTEAEQYIPYDIHEVEIRFFQIEAPEDDMGRFPYLLVACKRDVVEEYKNLIMNTGGKLEAIDSDIIALSNLIELNYPEDMEGNLAVINVGATTTNINILTDGVTFFNREVLKGGVSLTESISSKLGVSFEEAENLKIGDTIPEDLEEVLQELVEEVMAGLKQSFDFFLSTNPDMEVDKILLTGGTAVLHGLVEEVQNQLGITTEILDPLRNVKVPAKFEDELDGMRHLLGVAVALAVRNRNDWAT